MANQVVDNFESYTTGQLQGQDGWIGDTTFLVETSVKNSGTKAVSCTNNGEAPCRAPIGSPVASATQFFYFRVGVTNSGSGVKIYNSNPSEIGVFGVGLDGGTAYNVYDQSIPGYVDLTSQFGAVNNGAWLHCAIQWDMGNSRYRASVDGGATWCSYVQTETTGNPAWVGLIGPSVTDTAYWDDLSGPASGPTNVKSWNGLALASVGSINGLATASIKNINGLA